MKTVAALLALCASLVPAVASANCDLDLVGPTPHYAATVASVESWGPTVTYPQCEAEAEETDCDAEYLFGEACDAKLTRMYLGCVGREVCREAVQGWLEDDMVTGQSLGDMYGACLDLVAAAGGQD